MKNLKDILYGVAVDSVRGTTDLPIQSVAFDSRKTQDHTLFVAQKGLLFDGHEFIEKAIENGSVGIICEKFPEKIHSHITYIRVPDSNESLAIIASNFYGNPS